MKSSSSIQTRHDHDDPETADRTYIEPLTVECVSAIIRRERPDALLPTVGGQTALNLAIALDDSGVLEECGVEMIGAKREAIKIAEDRLLFKQAMDEAGMQMPRGGFAKSWAEAEVIVQRPPIPRSFARRLLWAAPEPAPHSIRKNLKRSCATAWLLRDS